MKERDKIVKKLNVMELLKKRLFQIDQLSSVIFVKND